MFFCNGIDELHIILSLDLSSEASIDIVGEHSAYVLKLQMGRVMELGRKNSDSLPFLILNSP